MLIICVLLRVNEPICVPWRSSGAQKSLLMIRRCIVLFGLSYGTERVATKMKVVTCHINGLFEIFYVRKIKMLFILVTYNAKHCIFVVFFLVIKFYSAHFWCFVMWSVIAWNRFNYMGVTIQIINEIKKLIPKIWLECYPVKKKHIKFCHVVFILNMPVYNVFLNRNYNIVWWLKWRITRFLWMPSCEYDLKV